MRAGIFIFDKGGMGKVRVVGWMGDGCWCCWCWYSNVDWCQYSMLVLGPWSFGVDTMLTSNFVTSTIISMHPPPWKPSIIYKELVPSRHQQLGMIGLSPRGIH